MVMENGFEFVASGASKACCKQAAHPTLRCALPRRNSDATVEAKLAERNAGEIGRM